MVFDEIYREVKNKEEVAFDKVSRSCYSTKENNLSNPTSAHLRKLYSVNFQKNYF